MGCHQSEDPTITETYNHGHCMRRWIVMLFEGCCNSYRLGGAFISVPSPGSNNPPHLVLVTHRLHRLPGYRIESTHCKTLRTLPCIKTPFLRGSEDLAKTFPFGVFVSGRYMCYTLQSYLLRKRMKSASHGSKNVPLGRSCFEALV